MPQEGRMVQAEGRTSTKSWVRGAERIGQGEARSPVWLSRVVQGQGQERREWDPDLLGPL